MKRIPQSLTVLFDEECGFCLRVVSKLRTFSTYFPVNYLPMRKAVELAHYSFLAEHVKAGRFIAVSEAKEVYLDVKARLMILYATKNYRSLAFTLSTPGLYSLVDLIFTGISESRDLLSQLFDKEITNKIKQELCESGTCELINENKTG